jgi:hypothetical protein
MPNGIDAAVELAGELGRLSEGDSVARAAPRGKDLYRYLAAGLSAQPQLGSPTRDEFLAITERLLARLSIWWSPAAYRRLPVMTPWCVRDRSCRYDQGPESWGAPRADGFLRDDNSIIKKLPLPVMVTAPAGHPYGGKKPWRGFTACHIWRNLPGGDVAGEDPWLYSFMPNLVWLPSWLAPLTDRQESHVQELLQRTSLALFRHSPVEPPIASYAEAAWLRLPVPEPGEVLPLGQLAMFDPEPAFFRRRLAYMDKFVAGCESLRLSGTLPQKLICTRYTTGLPALPAEVVAQFGDTLHCYSDAVRASLSISTR